MQVKSELRKFIVENFLYGQDDDSLRDDVSFLQNGFIDSTGILELVSFVQETYALPVSDDELVPDNFDSLNKLEAFISAKLAVGSETDNERAGRTIPVN